MISPEPEVVDRLLLFPDHGDRFLRAFVRAYPTTLAEDEIDLKILVDDAIRAVGGTEPAVVTFLLVDDRAKHPPRPGLAGSSFCWPADREALAFCHFRPSPGEPLQPL